MNSMSMSEIVHVSYQGAVRQSKTTLELLQCFYKYLQENRNKVRKEDEIKLENFIKSIYIEGKDKE